MPTVRHKNHYIYVIHLPDRSGNSCCICCVEIRHERQQVLSTRLMPDQSFATEQDATEHGFAVGKQWVDERWGLRESQSRSPEGSPILRIRMRWSGASLFSRS